MTVFRRVLGQGCGRVLRHWPLIVPLYGVSVLLGLLQTWPLWAAGSGALHNPLLHELAANNTDALLNVVLGSSVQATSAAAGAWVAAALGLAALFGLAYNFFAGGILGVYAGTQRFWAGCRHTFWGFTGLGLLIVALLVVALLVGVLAALVGGAVAGTIVAAVLVLLVNVVGEYARAAAVVHERRNPFVLVWLSLRFCAGKIGGVFGFVLVALLLGAALAAAYTGIASVLQSSVALVAVQQIVVFLLVALKLLRLSWALGYMGARTPRPASEPEPLV